MHCDPQQETTGLQMQRWAEPGLYFSATASGLQPLAHQLPHRSQLPGRGER